MSDHDQFCLPLVGQRLLSADKRDYSWFFVFSGDAFVVTEAAWRLLGPSGILITSEDHGQPFGLPAPVDASERLGAVVVGKAVVAASIDPRTGDLSIAFGEDGRLQFLQMSSGHEAWRLRAAGADTICTGGGDIVHFPRVNA